MHHEVSWSILGYATDLRLYVFNVMVWLAPGVWIDGSFINMELSGPGFANSTMQCIATFSNSLILVIRSVSIYGAIFNVCDGRFLYGQINIRHINWRRVLLRLSAVILCLSGAII